MTEISSKPKITSLDIARSWCKENGFIFPSSEIYGGFAAVYDYGHYGYLLKENIKKLWEKSMSQERNDVLLLDSAIFMHPKTWDASGHLSSFSDVLIEDKKTHVRYRADHLVEDWLNSKTKEELEQIATQLTNESVKEMVVKRNLDKATPEEIYEIMKVSKFPGLENYTVPRNFGLMVKSNLGVTDGTITDENAVYLRAETCQGIYLNFKNVLQSYRMKLPFGIAQVGKAFRNEIVARQFIFRTREFEQMEMQYFLHPSMMSQKFEEWKNIRMNWYIETLGINPKRLRFRDHDKLAHYASAACDIEYKFGSIGEFKEVEGIHARGDWDLGNHQKFSGENLDYFDQETNERFIPHVLETSVGLNRCVMMVIEDSLYEEEFKDTDGSKNFRTVMKIKKTLAPIKVAVLPLSKKMELQNKSIEVQSMLKTHFFTQYDETGSIGKRYRRQDEIGTPYCVTIDFETLNDNCVTVRDRDTMKQDRVSISDLTDYLLVNLNS
ncbi:glycine--tRNA ligase [Candidatus Dojkabacteria bacterium]|uniref:Glycine--tRNA ligase n=1 Tax=Candidatus Dojkabacteria bacterium TaxID=2099670 RepID=A0A3M0Z1P9_9BACT|nr:MAG: glycine--tRNA ligase [Candidatus Dojkabacteria bacterium]